MGRGGGYPRSNLDGTCSDNSTLSTACRLTGSAVEAEARGGDDGRQGVHAYTISPPPSWTFVRSNDVWWCVWCRARQYLANTQKRSKPGFRAVIIISWPNSMCLSLSLSLSLSLLGMSAAWRWSPAVRRGCMCCFVLWATRAVQCRTQQT